MFLIFFKIIDRNKNVQQYIQITLIKNDTETTLPPPLNYLNIFPLNIFKVVRQHKSTSRVTIQSLSIRLVCLFARFLNLKRSYVFRKLKTFRFQWMEQKVKHCLILAVTLILSLMKNKDSNYKLTKIILSYSHKKCILHLLCALFLINYLIFNIINAYVNLILNYLEKKRAWTFFFF